MSSGSFLKQRVRVTGLSARPDLNGQEGMCVAFEADRYSVAVNSDLTLRVKPANLELCHQTAPPSIPKKRGSDAVDLTADSESEMSSPSSSSDEEVSEFEDTDDSDVGASKKKARVR